MEENNSREAPQAVDLPQETRFSQRVSAEKIKTTVTFIAEKGSSAILFITLLRYVDRWWSNVSSSEPQNQLSWQSAYCAVFTIALANMADMPSKLSGYPAYMAFFMKASPSTCICSAFCSLATIAIMVCTHGIDAGFRGAVQHISVAKFGSERIVSIINRPVRLLIFLLGALPQAIKLYACRGILSTQIIVTCYLLDFVMDEMVMLWAQSQVLSRGGQTFGAHLNVKWVEDTIIENGIMIENMWSAFSWMVSVHFLIDQYDLSYALTFRIIGTMGIVCLLFPFFILAPMLSEHLPVERRIFCELVFVAGLLFNVVISCTVRAFERWKDGGRWYLLVSVGIFLHLPLFLGQMMMGMAWWKFAKASQMPFPSFMLSVTMMTNIFLWFAFSHEPEKTYKPSWVHWLG